jgi:hypothetical protein
MIAASRGSTPNTLETTSEVPLMLMMTSIREPKRTPSTTTPLRQFVAVETRPDEFGDRVALGHKIADLADEGYGRDHRETVRNRKPEEPGQAKRIGLRRGHHDRHRPCPDRDQSGHAEAKANFPVGDHEVLGVPDQFDFDIIDERQQSYAEKDLAGDPASGPQRLVGRKMEFVHGPRSVLLILSIF